MITLEIFDEIHVMINGLSPDEIDHIRSNIKKVVKGFHQDPAFKVGEWDGKTPHMTDDGLTYLYMLDEISPILENIGYDLDNDVEFKDNRLLMGAYEPIDKHFLSEYGTTLRDNQVNAVNAIVEHKSGVLELCPAAGKTLVSTAIIKRFSDMKTFVMTKNKNLVLQNHKEYQEHGLKSHILEGSYDRERLIEVFQENDVVVSTFNKFNSVAEYLEGFVGVFIYDEGHVFGEVTEMNMDLYMNGCPVRVSMTGSMPNKSKNPFKYEGINCQFNNGTISVITESECKELGHISDFHIDMIVTDDNHILNYIDNKDWSWDIEHKYLLSNQLRIDNLANYISSLSDKNTLILCESELGEKLSEILEYEFINRITKVKDRTRFYESFKDHEHYKLIATYGCGGVGVSINEIYRLVMIDPAKDEERILQGLGRSYRLDGELNFAEVIDISSNLLYSTRHRKERKKLYNKKEFDYSENQNFIKVQ